VVVAQQYSGQVSLEMLVFDLSAGFAARSSRFSLYKGISAYFFGAIPAEIGELIH
jgi:hypothetical protein